jgi:hypothetical protein
MTDPKHRTKPDNHTGHTGQNRTVDTGKTGQNRTTPFRVSGDVRLRVRPVARLSRVGGVRVVRDVVLGQALGYDRPRDIRKLIERLAEPLAKLGTARHRVAQYEKGQGARGEATEHLLNLALDAGRTRTPDGAAVLTRAGGGKKAPSRGASLRVGDTATIDSPVRNAIKRRCPGLASFRHKIKPVRPASRSKNQTPPPLRATTAMIVAPVGA